MAATAVLHTLVPGCHVVSPPSRLSATGNCHSVLPCPLLSDGGAYSGPGQQLRQQHSRTLTCKDSARWRRRSRLSACSARADSVVAPELVPFILQGPLLSKIGIGQKEVESSAGTWAALGSLLVKQLKFDAENLTEQQKRRLYHYYIPVFLWCQRQLREKRAGGSGEPITIGISAPQGCGKTTLVDSLEFLFRESGSPTAVVSIDDFYLTFAGQKELAATNAGNKLLELRGNAGSHDLALGTSTLLKLKSLTTPGAEVKLPRYDKSANSGRGDRASEDKWPTAKGPLEVVLFEGWMLGFEPVPEAQAEAVDPQLKKVNANLAAYSSAWDRQVDSWIVIQVDEPRWVFQWRLEAEVAMRSSGRPGMTDEQVADFVARYMPAYRAYLPGLYSKGPSVAKEDHVLRLQIDEKRNPLG